MVWRYWSIERLNDLKKILNDMSKPIPGSTQRILEFTGSLAHEVWKIDVTAHPDSTLQRVTAATILLSEMGVLNKGSRHGDRQFDPELEINEKNVEEARARQRSRRSQDTD